MNPISPTAYSGSTVAPGYYDEYCAELLEQIAQTQQLIIACLIAWLLCFALDKLLPY